MQCVSLWCHVGNEGVLLVCMTCIVFVVRSCMSSVVLSVSSLRFGVSILLLVLIVCVS